MTAVGTPFKTVTRKPVTTRDIGVLVLQMVQTRKDSGLSHSDLVKFMEQKIPGFKYDAAARERIRRFMKGFPKKHKDVELLNGDRTLKDWILKRKSQASMYGTDRKDCRHPNILGDHCTDCGRYFSPQTLESLKNMGSSLQPTPPATDSCGPSPDRRHTPGRPELDGDVYCTICGAKILTPQASI